MAELFNEEIISQATHTKWAGKTVHFARETDSTNLWGKRAWREEGAGHGELFVAEYQSAGRGRFTRRWSAPPDSAITMSILICRFFRKAFHVYVNPDSDNCTADLILLHGHFG